MAILVKSDEPQAESGHAAETHGMVYTFYSFKGGVGRSMALANVAALLAQWGKKVLILDWDLEAPGIEKFFDLPSISLSRSRQETPGVVDLLISQADNQPLSWRDCLIQVHLEQRSNAPAEGCLQMITAGKLATEDGRDYVARLRGLNWDMLFEQHDLGKKIESWRNEWIRDFDFILVDSRTGISDAGSICTILLPDILVMVFTSSHQSIEGIRDVLVRARAAHSQLPVARAHLTAVPLLSRDGRKEESDTAKFWRKKIASRMGDLYQDWLPAGVNPEDVLVSLYIPQFAYWSFGERLPVIEKREEGSDSGSIVAAYIKLARFLETELDWSSVVGNNTIPAEVARQLEAEKKKLEDQKQELDRKTREFTERLDREQKLVSSRTYNIRWMVLFAAIGIISTLVAVPPSWWPFPHVPGRIVAALFAMAGCMLFELLDIVMTLGPGREERTVLVSMRRLQIAFTSAVMTSFLPGSQDASFQDVYTWILIGIAFHLLLTHVVSVSTRNVKLQE